MTQKELLYMEDAVEHEKIIIAICNDAINRLEDKNLTDFFNSQIESHQDIKNNLMSLLKEKANG